MQYYPAVAVVVAKVAADQIRIQDSARNLTPIHQVLVQTCQTYFAVGPLLRQMYQGAYQMLLMVLKEQKTLQWQVWQTEDWYQIHRIPQRLE